MVLDRQILLSEVKEEYMRIANQECRMCISASAVGYVFTYYGKLMSQVLSRIEEGRFDGFPSGHSIVETLSDTKCRCMWGITL